MIGRQRTFAARAAAAVAVAVRVRHTIVRVQHSRRFPVSTHISSATRVVLHHVSVVVAARRRIVPRRTRRRRLWRWRRRRRPFAVVTPTRRARGTLLRVARLVSRRVPSLAVGPLAGPVSDVPTRGRRDRQRRRRVEGFAGRFIREQRRVRTYIVVLDERLSGDHGSLRVARRMLTSVRPMAFLVLSMAAALG